MRNKDGRLDQRHPKTLLKSADKIAREQGTNLTKLVGDFLAAYVRAHEPQAEESLGIEQA